MANSVVLEWGKDEIKLRELGNIDLPAVVKVTHGQYMKIGVTKSKHPENLFQELLLHSVQANKKVIAKALKVTHRGKKPSEVDLKLSIPLTYRGWFEVMSEDGRTSRPLLSVQELARCGRQICLVREAVKGYEVNVDNQLRLDREKVIPAGDQLRVIENKAISVPGRFKKIKFLHCMNLKNEHVYLSHDTRCAFSLVANNNSTSGVHTIESICSNFRLPLTVRIVHGSSPTALKNTKFSGILRLTSCETDQTAFFLPIASHALKEKMMPLPTSVPLKFCIAGNRDSYLHSSEIIDLNGRCAEMVSSYLTSIHVLVNIPDPGMYTSLREDTFSDSPVAPDKKRVVDVLFEEVDDLYGYVREGGKPPESRLCQAIGIESNDWHEPIYEYLDKYQQDHVDTDQTKDNVVEPPKTETPKAVPPKKGPPPLGDDKALQTVAVHRITTTGRKTATLTLNDIVPANGMHPQGNVLRGVQQPSAAIKQQNASHRVASAQYGGNNNAVERPIKTKIYHNDKLLVSYTKSTHSGSSGEKLSKHSKDKSSSCSKDSPTTGNKEVTGKKKTGKSMYL